MYFSYYMEMPDLIYIDFKELLEFFFLVMCLYIIIKICFIQNKPKQLWFFNKLFIKLFNKLFNKYKSLIRFITNKYLSIVKMFNKQVIIFPTFTIFKTILQYIYFYKIRYCSAMHNKKNCSYFIHTPCRNAIFFRVFGCINNDCNAFSSYEHNEDRYTYWREYNYLGRFFSINWIKFLIKLINDWIKLINDWIKLRNNQFLDLFDEFCFFLGYKEKIEISYRRPLKFFFIKMIKYSITKKLFLLIFSEITFILNCDSSIGIMLSFFLFIFILYTSNIIEEGVSTKIMISLKRFLMVVRNIISENLEIENNAFIVIFIFLFFYLSFLNLFAIYPYSFTSASHLTLTFYVSCTFFISLNLIALSYQSTHYFNLFLPTGVPIHVIPIIVFIEVISFVIRMLSLSIRLFVNMMAGHTLMKLIGVGIYILCFELSIAIPPVDTLGFIVLAFIFVFLILMEIFIAFLQAYLFVILMIYYLNSIVYISD